MYHSILLPRFWTCVIVPLCILQSTTKVHEYGNHSVPCYYHHFTIVPPLYCKGSHKMPLSYYVCMCVQNRAKEKKERQKPVLDSQSHFSSFEWIGRDRVDRKYQTKLHLSVLILLSGNVILLSGNGMVKTVYTEVVSLEIRYKNKSEWTWKYKWQNVRQNASERTDNLRELSISSRDKRNSCLTSLNAFFHLVFSSSTFRQFPMSTCTSDDQ